MDVTRSPAETLKLARSILTPEQLQRSWVYWNRAIQTPGTPITAGLQTLSMPFEGDYLFVDLAPGANWAHPCLYVFVENHTLATRVISGSFPPNVESAETLTLLLRHGKESAEEGNPTVVSR